MGRHQISVPDHLWDDWQQHVEDSEFSGVSALIRRSVQQFLSDKDTDETQSKAVVHELDDIRQSLELIEREIREHRLEALTEDRFEEYERYLATELEQAIEELDTEVDTSWESLSEKEKKNIIQEYENNDRI